MVNDFFSGEYHSVFKGRGMTFSEVREYSPGDDVRNIDWNVSARFGHPFVKVFEEERELTVMLLVDMSGSQEFGTRTQTKQELAAELSAIFAFSALKNNDKTGLILFTDKVEKFIPPKKSRSHPLRIIREVINSAPVGKKTDIKVALEYLNNMISKRAIIFLISDFQDKGYDKILKTVAKKHDLIAVVLEDEREIVLPKIGLISVKDPETGETGLINTSSPKFTRYMHSKWAEERNYRENLFRSAKADRIEIKTGESYIKPLISFFKLRGRR
ncbi:MAG: DUF58 domain-containing protein [Ignavibacteriales bacterium]|nr:DUF58 domain-containing protein [Ignavibacteriales bacterium]WKZ73663.1 MAG: DUF58 domain-containing protein [Ignavibacteriaceae bacterium]